MQFFECSIQYFLRLDSNIESKSSNNTYLKSFKHHPNIIFIIIFFSVYYIANKVYVTMPQAGFEPTEARVATYLHLVVRSTSKPPRLGSINYLFSLKNSRPWRDLNPGPTRYQANMLSTELSWLGLCQFKLISSVNVNNLC